MKAKADDYIYVSHPSVFNIQCLMYIDLFWIFPLVFRVTLIIFGQNKTVWTNLEPRRRIRNTSRAHLLYNPSYNISMLFTVQNKDNNKQGGYWSSVFVAFFFLSSYLLEVDIRYLRIYTMKGAIATLVHAHSSFLPSCFVLSAIARSFCWRITKNN